MHRALWIQYGCLSAAVAVATGAYGAHGLKTRVADEKLLKTWETAACKPPPPRSIRSVSSSPSLYPRRECCNGEVFWTIRAAESREGDV